MDNKQRAFLELVKAGLWGTEAKLSPYGVDYSAVNTLAEEQSVVGLVTAGLEHVTDVKVPQECLLQFIGSTLQVEQQNKEMNTFVAELIDKLRAADISAILIKGQGIAQCYEKPLWRCSGDVDLLLSEVNYRKANKLLSSIASSVDEENPYNQHIALTIDDWFVELHGTLRSGLWSSVDQVLDKVQGAVFNDGKVRSVEFKGSEGSSGSGSSRGSRVGSTQVFLPAPDEDVMFVFSHILQHFFKEGIGLRQICDWCRLMWTYRSELDLQLLESWIRKMGVMTEWKAFAALAVEYLGMPIEVMPLYSSNVKWKHKASRVMEFVLETGNFGHNRDYTYQQKSPYWTLKAISMWRHLKDFRRYFVIFPLDAVKVIWRRLYVGFSVVLKGKRHE